MADFKAKLNVLIIENNTIDTKILEDMLSRTDYGSFSVVTTDTLRDAFHQLNTGSFDAAVLDLNLRDSRGLDTLQKVNEKFPDLPIVINTGAYEDALGLKAVTSGAQDYLIKGKYKPYGLSKSLYYAVERKKAEKELQKAYCSIKETQGQLIQAEKMNVVGGVASGVAHEVKNPLATIIYGIEFLATKLENNKDEKVKLTLRSIKEAAQKANNIIRDLLDFSSLSNLKKTEEDINILITQSLNFIKYHCDNKKVTIKKEFSDNIPKVLIDKNRIEQVIIDVALNAVMAMGDGGGELTVRTYAKKINGDAMIKALSDCKTGDTCIMIELDDTGPGISQEAIDKVFDPFFTTRRASGGVGLGLSIARTIMSNHGGMIMMANKDDQDGARATLVLKATEGEQP